MRVSDLGCNDVHRIALIAHYTCICPYLYMSEAKEKRKVGGGGGGGTGGEKKGMEEGLGECLLVSVPSLEGTGAICSQSSRWLL